MPSCQINAIILEISQLTVPLFTGICTKGYASMEHCAGSARDRYTLIEQSPNYSLQRNHCKFALLYAVNSICLH